MKSSNKAGTGNPIDNLDLVIFIHSARALLGAGGKGEAARSDLDGSGGRFRARERGFPV